MDKKSFRVTAILLFVIVLAWGSYLRLWNLSSNPAGMFPDEASTGYDAWCLVNYGVDQHGKSWPFFFLSFADDLAGTYRYLAVLSERLFGATLLAVRIPAAITGILTIVFMFLAGKRQFSVHSSLFLAFLLATSPWHLPYCRTGQRIMLLPFILAIWLWQWTSPRRSTSGYQFCMSYFLLGLSVYTYVAARVIAPLIAIISLCIDYYRLPDRRKWLFPGVLALCLAMIPLAFHAFSEPELFQLRFQQVSVFSGYNSRVEAIPQLSSNYLKHFSLDYLFLRGDSNIRHNQKGFGMLVWGQIPFLIAGLWRMITRRNSSDLLMIGWLLVAPLPAALSIEGSPHGLRSVGMLLPFAWLSASGAHFLFRRFNTNSAIRILTSTAMVVIILEAFWISYDLMVKYPVYSAADWEYGTCEILDISQAWVDEYDEIWLSSEFLGADRIIAFSLKIPPGQFQKSGISSTPFRWIWHIPVNQLIQMPSIKNRLFAVRSDENIPLPDLKPPILFPDGQTAVRFIAD
jgi:4-amino-4-deoxy-L-arabinose transferase-like glycosyltransferase